jgi:5'(3')-deoxyribonucleotidase
MIKKIIWIDLDGVVADFVKRLNEYKERYPELMAECVGEEDRICGIFSDLPPIYGAVDAIHKLYESGKYELKIATSVPWNNPSAYLDKILFLEKYFGDMFNRKVTATHEKNMLHGDYLIDDRTKNGAGEFNGEHIHFGTAEFPTWVEVLEKLL